MANTIRNKRGTTKPAASDLVTGEIAVKTDDAKLFIENDSGYVFEVGETLGTFSSTTITYTVTVASKTSAHRYNGTGSSNGYKINGIFAPFLSLTAGNTYKFDQSDSSNSGHPLRFYLEADKTTAYTTNVTTNGTAGSSGAYTQIVITDATPIILHYQCSAHGYMGNSVTSNGTSIDGSNVTSGTIPDARLPDPLPAISGANLTSLPSSLIIQEEGSSLSTAATTLNFVGSSVTATGSGATKTITISSGGLSSDAQYNTVGGTNAGDSFSGTDATNNTLIGFNAGTAITTADNSTAIGYFALDSCTSGNDNTVLGSNAGKSITTGRESVIIGSTCGDSITTGNFNTLGGYYCGQALTTGQKNSFWGYAVGSNATTAGYNVGIGSNAFEALTSGEFNVGVGYQAADNITSGSSNTCVGQYAGNTLTTGSNNTCLGNNALPSAVDVSNEITLGNTSVTKFRIPALNFVVKSSTATEGHVLTVDANGEAGFAAASGGGGGVTSNDTLFNTFAGTDAGSSMDNNPSNSYSSRRNTFFGYKAGAATTTGHGNIYIGDDVALIATTASANIGIGREVFKGITAAINNNCIGNQSCTGSLTGSDNIVYGNYNMRSATSANRSVAIGNTTLEALTTGDENIAIGHTSQYKLTTGSQNTTIGYQALYFCTNGDGNVSIGSNSMIDTTTGARNTCMGQNAGTYITTSDNNMCLGYNAGTSSSPSGSISAGSNNICLGDNSISNLYCADTTISSSDQRDKTDINSFNLGLAWVEALRPVTYRWDRRTWYGTDEQPYGTPDGSKKRSKLHVGFLAQEALAVEQSNGYGTSNDNSITIHLNEDGMSYGMKYERLVPILVNAIKELSTRVKVLEAG